MERMVNQNTFDDIAQGTLLLGDASDSSQNSCRWVATAVAKVEQNRIE